MFKSTIPQGNLKCGGHCKTVSQFLKMTVAMYDMAEGSLVELCEVADVVL
jgi:hypothetical protein